MSIGPDNLFIPRVGFKVNLLVISTDRKDQHIQNWGGAQARSHLAILLQT